MSGETRGWFGLTKRFARVPGDGPDPSPHDDRNMGAGGNVTGGNGSGGGWDMKSLLAAAETREGPQTQHRNAPQPHVPHPQHPQHRRTPQPPDRNSGATHAHPYPPHGPANAAAPNNSRGHLPMGNRQAGAPPGPASRPHDGAGHHTSSNHMIETLQAMAIDLDRFLEDDPPLDLLRRYRNGERNVFARRLVNILDRDQTQRIGQKHREDGEFRETVDLYVQQFETLMEHTARSDRENVLVETHLASPTGKVYVALASAIGRLA